MPGGGSSNTLVLLAVAAAGYYAYSHGMFGGTVKSSRVAGGTTAGSQNTGGAQAAAAQAAAQAAANKLAVATALQVKLTTATHDLAKRRSKIESQYRQLLTTVDSRAKAMCDKACAGRTFFGLSPKCWSETPCEDTDRPGLVKDAKNAYTAAQATLAPQQSRVATLQAQLSRLQ